MLRLLHSLNGTISVISRDGMESNRPFQPRPWISLFLHNGTWRWLCWLEVKTFPPSCRLCLALAEASFIRAGGSSVPVINVSAILHGGDARI